MRPGQLKRPRGRTQPNNNTNNNRRGPGNNLSRSYESNGPDIKVRGTAHQIAEKYVQLWRDSQSAGDPVAAENYLQHAEHYYRIVAAAQSAYPNGGGLVRADDERFDNYADNEEGEDPNTANRDNADKSEANAGGQQSPHGQEHGFQPRESRPPREPREEYRPPREAPPREGRDNTSQSREFREREPRGDYRNSREDRPYREPRPPRPIDYEGQEQRPQREHRPPRLDYDNQDSRPHREPRPPRADFDDSGQRPQRDNREERFPPRDRGGRPRVPRPRYNQDDQPEMGGLPSFITGGSTPVVAPAPVNPISAQPVSTPVEPAAPLADPGAVSVPVVARPAPALPVEAVSAPPAPARRGRPPKVVSDASTANAKVTPRKRSVARKEDVPAD
jgi:hypothetical protein